MNLFDWLYWKWNADTMFSDCVLVASILVVIWLVVT